MNFRSIVLAFLLCALVIPQSTQAQDSTDTSSNIAKNAIYATGGYLFLAFQGKISYERMIVEPQKWLNTSVSIRADFSHLLAIDPLGYYYSTIRYNIYGAGVTIISGKKNTKVEFNLGYAFFRDVSEGVSEPEHYKGLTGALGLRYQKPNSGLILRFGGGFLDLVYVSAGYVF